MQILKASMKRRTKDILKLDGALNFGGKTNEEGGAMIGDMQLVKRELLAAECDFDPVEKEYHDTLQFGHVRWSCLAFSSNPEYFISSTGLDKYASTIRKMMRALSEEDDRSHVRHVLRSKAKTSNVRSNVDFAENRRASVRVFVVCHSLERPQMLLAMEEPGLHPLLKALYLSYSFRAGLCSLLSATNVSTFCNSLSITLTNAEKNSYLEPIRDLPEHENWLKKKFRKGYRVSFVGDDVLTLSNRIYDPERYWSKNR
ncbi:unnamed protein product [Cercospora beticola]|nr:unnamed protein product [Cercospora beticola]